MPFTRLHYHLIWTTFAREPRLTEELDPYLQQAISTQVDELHAQIHALGSVADHIHLVVSLPPRLAVADCIRNFKRAGVQAINRRLGADGNLSWQTGYGAITLDERSLYDVVAYVQDHREHHRANKLFAPFEQTSDDEQ